MRYRLLRGILWFGVVSGLLLGLFHSGCFGGRGWVSHEERHRQFEEHVADVCLRAATRMNPASVQGPGQPREATPSR